MATDQKQDRLLILASASPRRRELLGRFGFDFDICPADIDESVRPTESARAYVSRMAEEKAVAVAEHYPDRIILAADTSVVVDGEILGKPGDADQARAMLNRLSDREHQVMTAVAVISLAKGAEASFAAERNGCRLSVTKVFFAALEASWITRYVNSGDPMDKAGGYGIQNAAGLKIRRIDGSYSGVVGLPLFETGQLLTQAGLTAS